MSLKNVCMNIEQAKKIDLVDYLKSHGHHPTKVRGQDYWYPSPLREEKTPSFKINRTKNEWYDFGDGKGGNFIDFGVLYHKCSVKDLLYRLDNNLSFHQQAPINVRVQDDPIIQILAEKDLSTFSLMRYLKQRRIAENIARKYCREVTFALRDKKFTAIGFKNDQGGFELRNQWYKGSSSPKGVTSIQNGSQELAVFEGFFDFLSYQTINQHCQQSAANMLVLNSNSFFEMNKDLMERHEHVRLFLDRDNAGQSLSTRALSWSGKYKDESSLYQGYKDINEWHTQIGKSQKLGLKQ